MPPSNLIEWYLLTFVDRVIIKLNSRFHCVSVTGQYWNTITAEEMRCVFEAHAINAPNAPKHCNACSLYTPNAFIYVTTTRYCLLNRLLILLMFIATRARAVTMCSTQGGYNYPWYTMDVKYSFDFYGILGNRKNSTVRYELRLGFLAAPRTARLNHE